MTTPKRSGARASRRARAIRTRRATSSATAFASTTRSTARASRRCCCCRPGRSSTRGTGRCRSRTSRGTAASSPSTGAATAARTGPPESEAYDEREFAADALAVMDATETERSDPRRRLAAVRTGARSSPPSTPERVDGLVFIGPAVALVPGHPERQVYAFDEEYDTDEGWAKYNSHFWLARLPRLPRVLLRAVLQRAALDEADRGRRRLGARDRPGDARRHEPRDLAVPHRALPRHSARACAARCSSSTATPISSVRMPRAPRSRRRPAGRSSRSRAPATFRMRATQ